jgi:hypothetical protein
MTSPLLGQGVRVQWPDVPSPVRSAVAAIAGGEVVSARACVGGFSPGAAVVLSLAGGRRVFVKTVSTAQNPMSPEMYRREARVHAWLPAHPAVPALLGTYDDGDWVALVLEHVDAGTPPLPWAPADLDAVVAAVLSVQRAAAPVPAAVARVEDQYAEDFAAWRAMAAVPPAGLDAWSAAHLAECAAVEAGWSRAAAGDALLHTDLRADNVLVRDGRAWVVDWPWACAGAEWVDGVLMAPSVALQVGPAPEALMARMYPAAPLDGVRAVVAALAGFFTRAALAPPPPGLPTLRAHQAAHGAETRKWLARLLAC